MKQYGRQKCACGALALVTPTDSPYEFDLVCALCGRSKRISWPTEHEPPKFLPDADAKITLTKPHGRKAGEPGQRRPMQNLVGMRFGDLVVQAYAGTKDRRRHWLCRCVSTIRNGSECGNTRTLDTAMLNRVGGRRCKPCNQHLLQGRSRDYGRWMHKQARKTLTVKG